MPAWRRNLEAAGTQPRLCKQCNDPIQPRNTSGYCREHAYLARRKFPDEPKFCRICEAPIKPWNESGYCAKHKHIGEAEALKKTQVAKEPQFCAHCGKILAPSNKSGYCTAHHEPYQRAEPRFCQEPGCKNKKRLRSDCKTGFCMAHRFRLQLSKRKFCKEEGCSKRLGRANKIGYCPKHRKLHFAEQDRVAAARRTAKRLKVLRDAEAELALYEAGGGQAQQPHPAHRTADPTKVKLYKEAAELYATLKQTLRSWPNVAKQLTPAEYAKDPKAAGARLRLGAKYHQQI